MAEFLVRRTNHWLRDKETLSSIDKIEADKTHQQGDIVEVYDDMNLKGEIKEMSFYYNICFIRRS